MITLMHPTDRQDDFLIASFSLIVCLREHGFFAG